MCVCVCTDVDVTANVCVGVVDNVCLLEGVSMILCVYDPERERE